MSGLGVYSFALLAVITNSTPMANDDNATSDEDGSYRLRADERPRPGRRPAHCLERNAAYQGHRYHNGTDVTYAPNANLNGTDSFIYTAVLMAGGIDTAVVTVTANPVNDSPVSSDDDAGVPVTVDVLANYSDAEATY